MRIALNGGRTSAQHRIKPHARESGTRVQAE